MGLCLELAYPITSGSGSGPGSDGESRDVSRDSAPFRHRLPLNAFIDSILRTVYHHASAPPPTTTTPDGHGVRRPIIFTSSSPDACAAVNWKQPNCQSPIPISFFFPPACLAITDICFLKKKFYIPSSQTQSYSRHRAAVCALSLRAQRQPYAAKRRRRPICV